MRLIAFALLSVHKGRCYFACTHTLNVLVAMPGHANQQTPKHLHDLYTTTRDPSRYMTIILTDKRRFERRVTTQRVRGRGVEERLLDVC